MSNVSSDTQNPLVLIIIAIITLTFASCNGCDTRHKAKIYKIKNHHIVMQDDQGKWWEYVLKNMDIDVDIPFTGGELKLPSGGSWRAATKAEEEEIDEATNEEETTVDESTNDAGASPDGSGDVGGDSGGGDGGGGGDD